MTLLETVQSVASSVIFYQLLKSGDVEQNPGPGNIVIIIINLSVGLILFLIRSRL